MLALEGIRVVDLSRLLPGPLATRMLAEMGAEVLKVEDPKGGDYARWYPPVFGDPAASASFRAMNYGKKSIALDLKTDDAKQALRALIASADVLVDSFRPGVLTRLGFDPEQLLEEHPRLIYCAITGFGLQGPDARRAGHDLGYIARAGVLDLGDDADRPRVPGVQIADVGAALSAVGGITAALLRRHQTQAGGVVDVSLMESAAFFTTFAYSGAAAGEPVGRARELLDGSRPCYSIYETSDGRHLAVGALEPKFWALFCQLTGLEELVNSGLDTGERAVRTKQVVQVVLRTKTLAEWQTHFEGHEACIEPVLTLTEAAADPQALSRPAACDPHARPSPLGVETAKTLPPSPDIGQHTAQVLGELDLPEELVRRLAEVAPNSIQ